MLFTFLLTAGGANAATPGNSPITVVELYTSQGCSSCPPAHTVVGDLVDQAGVLPLSFHVDYWDYLGWKDPFASPVHTARQRVYGQQFKIGYVYTPQIVVQGKFQGTGSDRRKIHGYIAQAKSLPHIAIKLMQQGESLRATFPVTSLDAYQGKLDVIAVYFDNQHETAIKRGENSGETLASYNVVRKIERLGTWDGAAEQLPVPPLKGKGENCVVILQSAVTGQIVGAALSP